MALSGPVERVTILASVCHLVTFAIGQGMAMENISAFDVDSVNVVPYARRLPVEKNKAEAAPHRESAMSPATTTITSDGGSISRVIVQAL